MSFLPRALQFLFDLSIPLFNSILSISNKQKAPDYADGSTQTDVEDQEGPKEEQVVTLATKKTKDHSWMLENANDNQIVLSMTPRDIQQSPNEVSSKDRYRLLCSYSWIQTESPTIYVPGTPASFVTRKIPKGGLQIPADAGQYWTDQHAYRVPIHQFEPTFQALTVTNPEVRFNDVDIVVNRSSLSILLRLLKDQSFQAFHLDLDIVGSTLFLGRKVKNPKTGSVEESFGRSFEAHFTAKDLELENAEGHHRVLRYNFGGLDMVVRIEADAYLPDAQHEEYTTTNHQPAFVLDPNLPIGIDHKSPQPTKIITKGTFVPQSSIMELKSNERSRPKEQMWFGRTPFCCLGRHVGGLVKHAQVKEVTDADFEKWEAGHQQHLQKLAWFLQKLRTVVMEKTCDGSAVLVALGKGQPVEIFATKKKIGALPKEIVERFWT